MRHRSNVSPVPLSVERRPEEVVLTYLDGRVVTYAGPFEPRDGSVTANRSFAVHVLVVDHDTDQGVMTYVNDLDTSDDILESTGVGRVILDDGDREVLYPGVEVRRSGEEVTVTTDETVDDAAVYTFIENARGEAGVILTPAEDHCK